MIKKQWPLPFVIAHRGAPLLAPENTIAALKKAKERGATAVEFDIQLTRDLKPVIFHDAQLNRTTNGRGRLSEVPFSKIQTLDAGAWFSADFKGERIPTLAEWLQCAAKLKLILNLEIKCNTKKEAIALADVLIDHLQKYWPAHSTTLLISSSNAFALMQVAERAKSLPLGFISDTALSEKNIETLLSNSNIVSVHHAHQVLTEDYVDRLHSNDLHVLAYTVNDFARMAELRTMGVDGVFTDNDKMF